MAFASSNEDRRVSLQVVYNGTAKTVSFFPSNVIWTSSVDVLGSVQLDSVHQLLSATPYRLRWLMLTRRQLGLAAMLGIALLPCRLRRLRCAGCDKEADEWLSLQFLPRSRPNARRLVTQKHRARRGRSVTGACGRTRHVSGLDRSTACVAMEQRTYRARERCKRLIGLSRNGLLVVNEDAPCCNVFLLGLCRNRATQFHWPRFRQHLSVHGRQRFCVVGIRFTSLPKCHLLPSTLNTITEVRHSSFVGRQTIRLLYAWYVIWKITWSGIAATISSMTLELQLRHSCTRSNCSTDGASDARIWRIA